jgi:hypothetical protein
VLEEKKMFLDRIELLNGLMDLLTRERHANVM